MQNYLIAFYLAFWASAVAYPRVFRLFRYNSKSSARKSFSNRKIKIVAISGYSAPFILFAFSFLWRGEFGDAFSYAPIAASAAAIIVDSLARRKGKKPRASFSLALFPAFLIIERFVGANAGAGFANILLTSVFAAASYFGLIRLIRARIIFAVQTGVVGLTFGVWFALVGADAQAVAGAVLAASAATLFKSGFGAVRFRLSKTSAIIYAIFSAYLLECFISLNANQTGKFIFPSPFFFIICVFSISIFYILRNFDLKLHYIKARKSMRDLFSIEMNSNLLFFAIGALILAIAFRDLKPLPGAAAYIAIASLFLIFERKIKKSGGALKSDTAGIEKEKDSIIA